MIGIRPRLPDAPDLADRAADELLAALRDTARERDATTARRDRLAADLARRETEQRAALARTRQAWGPGFDVAVPPGDREGERLRANLVAAEARLPAIAAWRGEVLDALRRRVAREETTIAEEAAALDRDAATLADRRARLCALWAPLAAFEGLPAGDPPIAGATQQAALGLRGRREALDRRERALARLRAALG
jgi:hypothetical protein